MGKFIRKKTMNAKITHMWGNWKCYFVNSVDECRDETDKSAYEALLALPEETTVQMGKVNVEKVVDCSEGTHIEDYFNEEA